MSWMRSGGVVLGMLGLGCGGLGGGSTEPAEPAPAPAPAEEAKAEPEVLGGGAFAFGDEAKLPDDLPVTLGEDWKLQLVITGERGAVATFDLPVPREEAEAQLKAQLAEKGCTEPQEVVGIGGSGFSCAGIPGWEAINVTFSDARGTGVGEVLPSMNLQYLRSP